MRKVSATKLGPYVGQLEQWLGIEQLTLAEVRQRLAALGCSVSQPTLSRWWRARRQDTLQTQLLAQIVSGAVQCQQLEAEFSRNPPPAMDLLLNLLRSLTLRLSTQATVTTDLVPLLGGLMRVILSAGRLDTSQKQLDLAERKYQAQTDAQHRAEHPDALTPATLEKIERELHLF